MLHARHLMTTDKSDVCKDINLQVEDDKHEFLIGNVAKKGYGLDVSIIDDSVDEDQCQVWHDVKFGWTVLS